MKSNPLFDRYEKLVSAADRTFERMQRDYPDCVSCAPHCADCCHAVFGVFMIEAAYLRHHFLQLPKKVRLSALTRGEEMDRELETLQERLKAFENDTDMKAYSLARERIRCPLLNESEECILYPHRPITCRVYGIPTIIQGQARVCRESGFEAKKSYPAFDLDATYKELYLLSGELLGGSEAAQAADKASLLVSVSMAIRTPIEDIITEDFVGPRADG